MKRQRVAWIPVLLLILWSASVGTDVLAEEESEAQGEMGPTTEEVLEAIDVDAYEVPDLPLKKVSNSRLE